MAAREAYSNAVAPERVAAQERRDPTAPRRTLELKLARPQPAMAATVPSVAVHAQAWAAPEAERVSAAVPARRRGLATSPTLPDAPTRVRAVL